MEEFTYVLIPADSAKPVVELRHRKNKTLEDDNLRDELTKYFVSASIITADQTETLVESLRDQAKQPVDDATLRRMADVVSVDTFPLTVPTKTSPYAVSLYCDAKSVAKELRPNERADGLAAACGSPSQNFRGDVFASRYFDDDDQWIREDFRLSDLSSDADWLKAAKAKRPTKPGAMQDLYGQLGGDNKQPVTIDPRTIDRENMQKSHDCGSYDWSQTSDDVEVRIKQKISSKKDLKVHLTRSSLKVQEKDQVLLNIPKLYGLVDADTGANWTLDDQHVVLTLDKFQPSQTPWPTLSS